MAPTVKTPVKTQSTVREQDIISQVTETPAVAGPAPAPQTPQLPVPAPAPAAPLMVQLVPSSMVPATAQPVPQANPHRPVAHGRGKVWSIKRVTNFRRIKLNPFDESLMRAPSKWTIGSAIAVLPGLAAGQLSLYGAQSITDWVGGLAGVSGHPWYPVGRDVGRLGIGAALGLGLWPSLVKWGVGPAHADLARGAFVGAAIPWVIDLAMTSIRYAKAAYSGQAVGPSGVGLGALGDLIKGTAMTARDAGTAATAAVAGNVGDVSGLGGSADLLGELGKEMERYKELTRLSGMPSQGAIGASAPMGTLLR